MQEMKSVIVTGAAGFIGVHLCERWLKKGYKVVGIDNLSTGSRFNSEYLTKNFENFYFFEVDACENWNLHLQSLGTTFFQSLETVFHFASPASPIYFDKMALEIMKVNSVGLENAISFADRFGARVIFASTSEVYGDPAISPQPESYWGYTNSFGPRSCYDEGKRFGEALIYSSNKIRKTRHGLVRIFNTYGPRMNWQDGRVVINFLHQAINGQPLTIYGNGGQTRSFCYIDDLVDGILAYTEKQLTFPLNIGNHDEFRVIDLAHMVQRLLKDHKVHFVFRDLPQEDPKQRCPDLTQTLKWLPGWRPKTSLEEGLISTLRWLKEEPEANSTESVSASPRQPARAN